MMRKLPIYVLGLVCFLISEMAVGQQFPMTNHYLINPYSLSPATAGSRDKGAFFFNYRKDWLNFMNAGSKGRYVQYVMKVQNQAPKSWY